MSDSGVRKGRESKRERGEIAIGQGTGMEMGTFSGDGLDGWVARWMDYMEGGEGNWHTPDQLY